MVVRPVAEKDRCQSSLDCEYVGIVRIDQSFIQKFRKNIVRMVNAGDHDNWWEGVLYDFIDDGIGIFHQDVEGAFWTEVDHLDDYNRLVKWHSSQAIERAPAGPCGRTVEVLTEIAE